MMSVIIVAGVAGCHAMDRHHIAAMLNVEKLPASISDIDCSSFSFTDVLERCAFRIAPADFNALLGGYKYVEAAPCQSGDSINAPCFDAKERAQSSHTFCCGPQVGPDFPISHTFIVSPKEFAHGGTVTVIADRSRSQAMVDLYIE